MFTSPRIAFGEDSLEQLSAIEGKRVLVVTDPVVRKLGMLDNRSQRAQEGAASC